MGGERAEHMGMRGAAAVEQEGPAHLTRSQFSRRLLRMSEGDDAAERRNCLRRGVGRWTPGDMRSTETAKHRRSDAGFGFGEQPSAAVLGQSAARRRVFAPGCERVRARARRAVTREATPAIFRAQRR